MQLALERAWNRASMLAGPEDFLPEGALRLLVNTRLDRQRGHITSRPGLTQLTTAEIMGSLPIVLAHTKLFGVSADYGYAQVSSTTSSSLYRFDAAWTDGSKTLLASNLPTTVLSETNFLDGYTKPWKFMVGPLLRKDDGTTLRLFGITAPTAPPASVTLAAQARVSISAMDVVGSWTGGLATSGTIKQEGTNSLTAIVATDTLSAYTLALTGANSVRTGTHTGANNMTSLVDAAATFTTLPIRLGSQVRNITKAFTATVTRITGTELFFDGGLSGGEDFDTGDNYNIYFNLDSFQLTPGAASGTDNSGVSNKAFQLVDTTKDFVREGVTAGMVVWNKTDGARGVITSIGETTNPHDTLHVTGGLTGGVENDFDTGDSYTVFNDLVKDDDWIHLFVRLDLAANLEFMQLDFDLDGAGYANNYYSVKLSVDRISSGAGQWTELLVRKSEFQRFGTGTETWAAVVGVRISVQTNSEPAGMSIWLDDLSLVGGIGLEGDIAYTAIYVNENTGCLSAPPKTDDEVVSYTQTVTAKRQGITVNLSNISSPVDTQITHFWLYRNSVTLPDPTFVASFPVGTTSFLDTRADVQLDNAKVLEPDNDPPPSTAKVLMGPGALQRLFILHARNKVRFSKRWETKRSRAENWPPLFEFQIGDGSQEVLNGIVLDQTVVIFSESGTWEVLGQGPDAFLPLPIPLSRGLAAREAIAFGDGQIFFLALDGVYAQVGLRQSKLTDETLDPFFSGETVHGHLPINRAAIATCRLEWYPHPQDPEVVLLYPEGSRTTPNKRLVLKRNPQTGQYTEAFFDSTTGIAMRSIYVDPQSLTLSYGGNNSRLYQAEVATANSDDGSALVCRVRTGARDQGTPRHLKSYSDVVVEANTQGQVVNVTASFNRSTETQVLGTLTGTSDASQQQLLITTAQASSVLRRRNIALDLTWSSTARVTISQLGWHAQVEPEAVIFVDSKELPFAFVTYVKYYAVDIDAPANVTVATYLDGTLRDTRVLFATVGRARVQHYLPAELKGRVLRVTLTSATAFQPWGLLAFTKAAGQAIGYKQQQLPLLAS